MTDDRDDSTSIRHPLAAIPPERTENVAAEDLGCLQSALDDWQREHERQLARSHAMEVDAHAKLQHAELRLHQAVSQLDVNKRSTHAMRVRLEADIQAARARAQQAQEALTASQDASEQLRMTNAELTTALDAVQWRLGELDTENAMYRETLLQTEHQRHGDHQRLTELDAERSALYERESDVRRQLADLGKMHEASRNAWETERDTLKAHLAEHQRARAEATEALAQAHTAHTDDLRIWQDTAVQHTANLDAARQKAAALATHTQELEAEIRAAHQQHQHLDQQLAAAHAERLQFEGERQSERDILTGRVQSLEDALRERDTIIAQLRGDLQRQRESDANEFDSWRENAARREAELAAAHEALTHQLADEQCLARNANEEVAALAARVRDVEAELLAAHQPRQETEERLAAAHGERAEIQARHHTERSALEEELQRSRMAHSDAFAVWQEQAAQHVAHSEVLASRAHSLETDLRQREACIDQLWHELAQREERHLQAMQAAADAAQRREEEWSAAGTGEDRAAGAEQRAAELELRGNALAQQLEALQKQSELAQPRRDAMAGQIAELEHERSTLGLRVDELTALTGQLERECDRLRRDRGSIEETRRLKADNARLENKIVELDRQRSEAAQRHSAAVAGYMVELNQRSEALQARGVELQKVMEELALLKQSCEDAMSDLAAQRREQDALERELAKSRATPAPAVSATPSEPIRLATPVEARPSAAPPAVRPAPAKPARQPSQVDTVTGPVTVIHLEENKTLCDAARDVVARLPDARYMNALEATSPDAPGSRLLVVNLLSRAHDPVEAIASFIAADNYHRNVLAYCAEGANGFSFGTADFFAHPIDPDACVARLLESRGTIQRLLVVTENFGVVGMLRNVLSRMQSSVSAALDLRQAIDLLPMVEPDVVLIDLGLPRGEGLRLVGRLRSDPKTRDLALAILLAAPGGAGEFRQHALRAARDLPMAPTHLAEALSQRLGTPRAGDRLTLAHSGTTALA